MVGGSGATSAALLACGGDERHPPSTSPAAFLPSTTELIRRKLRLD